MKKLQTQSAIFVLRIKNPFDKTTNLTKSDVLSQRQLDDLQLFLQSDNDKNLIRYDTKTNYHPFILGFQFQFCYQFTFQFTLVLFQCSFSVKVQVSESLDFSVRFIVVVSSGFRVPRLQFQFQFSYEFTFQFALVLFQLSFSFRVQVLEYLDFSFRFSIFISSILINSCFVLVKFLSSSSSV